MFKSLIAFLYIFSFNSNKKHLMFFFFTLLSLKNFTLLYVKGSANPLQSAKGCRNTYKVYRVLG